MSLNDEMARQANEANAAQEIDRLRARVAELERERDALRAVMRKLEWMWEEYAPTCPWCGKRREYGHDPDCGFLAALEVDHGE